VDAPVESPISVRIVEGPLPASDAFAPPPGAGALLVFEGVVRPFEDDSPITALDYEAYEPMASMQLQRLAEDVVDKHELGALHAAHSTGRVPAGACSFRLHVAAAHRAEALAAMTEFIDRLKRDVPIWKSPVPV
jgi:molybdopterin synthase catalytic subunit